MPNNLPWMQFVIDTRELSQVEVRFKFDGAATTFEVVRTKREDVLIPEDQLPNSVELSPDCLVETPAPIKRPVRAPILKSTSLYPTDFVLFWSAYPQRKNKGAALRAWKRLDPDTALKEKIFKAIETQSRSKEWLKDNGEFIPHPASWLNGRRWEDDAAVGDIEGDRMRANTAATVAMMSSQDHFE